MLCSETATSIGTLEPFLFDNSQLYIQELTIKDGVGPPTPPYIIKYSKTLR